MRQYYFIVLSIYVNIAIAHIVSILPSLPNFNFGNMKSKDYVYTPLTGYNSLSKVFKIQYKN